MKESAINLLVSKQLHDDIQAKAKEANLSMATYIRTVLAHQIYGKNSLKILGEKVLVLDGDEEQLLDV